MNYIPRFFNSWDLGVVKLVFLRQRSGMSR